MRELVVKPTPDISLDDYVRHVKDKQIAKHMALFNRPFNIIIMSKTFPPSTIGSLLHTPPTKNTGSCRKPLDGWATRTGHD